MNQESRMTLRKVVVSLLVAAGIAAAGPAAAQAGTFKVVACDNDNLAPMWFYGVSNGAISGANRCAPAGQPQNLGLYLSNTPDPITPAPLGSEANFLFRAPKDAKIVAVGGSVRGLASSGWSSGILDYENGNWLWCGPGCPAGSEYTTIFVNSFASTVIGLDVTCQANGCRRDSHVPFAWLEARNLEVTISDSTRPVAKVLQTGLATGGPRGGRQTLSVEAFDNVGIQQVTVEHGGVTLGSQRPNGVLCDWHYTKPCPEGTAPVEVDLRPVPDGQRSLSVRVVDAAQNETALSVPVLVDNAPPPAPQSLSVEGGEGWRTTNAFTLAAQRPADDAVARLRYELCPSANEPGKKTGCVTGTLDPDRTEGFAVPGEGSWRLRGWYEDTAGNADPNSAREVTLRFDGTVPNAGFTAPSADAPTQVRVDAQDAASSVAGGTVELRAAKSQRWQALPATVDSSGIVATLPDETLRDGVYALRATVVDAAGNARAIEQRPDGTPATVTLPVRLKTSLSAGRSVRVKSRRGKRHNRLVTVPRLSYGRALRLHGRLVGPDRKGMAGRQIVVMQRTDTPSAAWRPLTTTQTSRTGRFNVLAHSGPRRDIRFRYEGTNQVRAATAAVQMRVRAVTTIRPNRRSVVNGEDVIFRGRLKVRPGASKLVVLQAYTRGRWATFANPRANPRTGRWSYRYRFTATRGSVTYRIRALVPREASYPFDSGQSRPVRVRVRGL